MRIVIDPTSALAPYDQVRQQIIAQVRSGELIAETKLPTVRQLAAELSLAPNTVARAYRELELAGVLVTRGRNGTFIAPGDDPVLRIAEVETTHYVGRMRELGLDAAAVVDLVQVALRQ
jgi:DNA-binding transcriptional regulator YhcF (GntR family)